jgi:hypothetical protein
MSVDAPERPSRTELSQAPSWILLGFVIGAVFVLLLRRQYLVEEAMLNPPVAGAAAIDTAGTGAISDGRAGRGADRPGVRRGLAGVGASCRVGR